MIKFPDVKEENDPKTGMALTSSVIDLRSAPGLYVGADRAKLASSLFAMSVDLEAILERKKKTFRSGINAFIDEVESRKAGVSFQARSISVPVADDERVSGLYSFLLGFFGYERRRSRTRYVHSHQLNTREISEKIGKFITDAQRLFEAKFENAIDVENTVQECMRIASDRLCFDELTILRAVIRRSFSKISTKPWQICFKSKSPYSLLRDTEEIRQASENAERDFEDICTSLIAEATTARKLFEEDIEGIISGIKGELVAACLDREQMEHVLMNAMVHEMQLKFSHSGLKVVSSLDGDFRRALLRNPSEK